MVDTRLQRKATGPASRLLERYPRERRVARSIAAIVAAQADMTDTRNTLRPSGNHGEWRSRAVVAARLISGS
ncbi:hypothetical protein GCM10025331_56110 [Actinoplanes utahensis]|nr:hypothetical protein Aut01nite_63690 [Actinoplanes utahensis]